jgi:hypothetical protein
MNGNSAFAALVCSKSLVRHTVLRFETFSCGTEQHWGQSRPGCGTGGSVANPTAG